MFITGLAAGLLCGFLAGVFITSALIAAWLEPENENKKRNK